VGIAIPRGITRLVIIAVNISVTIASPHHWACNRTTGEYPELPTPAIDRLLLMTLVLAVLLALIPALLGRWR